MMVREFIERTHVAPSYEEYRFIEESYYEFDGNKDEFCKWWLKSKESGEWAKELKFRQTIKEMERKHREEIKELHETIEFYRPYFDEVRKLQKNLETAKMRLEAIVKDLA